MPEIESAYHDLRDTGFIVLGVNAGEDGKQARTFAERYGLSFPILLDRDWDAATAYGVTGLPTSFLVDRNGIIVDEVMGGKLTRSALIGKLHGLGMVAP